VLLLRRTGVCDRRDPAPNPHRIRSSRENPAAEGQVNKGAWRITNWNDAGDRQPCPRWFANPDYRADTVLISIPKRCVGDPRQIRWNVRTWNVTRYNPDGGWRGFADAVPGWNTFRGSPWTVP
jgi:hypothetical protein